MKKYISDYNMPETIVSDRDIISTSKFGQAIVSVLETKHKWVNP